MTIHGAVLQEPPAARHCKRGQLLDAGDPLALQHPPGEWDSAVVQLTSLFASVGDRIHHRLVNEDLQQMSRILGLLKELPAGHGKPVLP